MIISHMPETKLLEVTSGFAICDSVEGEFSVGIYLYLMVISEKHYYFKEI